MVSLPGLKALLSRRKRRDQSYKQYDGTNPTKTATSTIATPFKPPLSSPSYLSSLSLSSEPATTLTNLSSQTRAYHRDLLSSIPPPRPVLTRSAGSALSGGAWHGGLDVDEILRDIDQMRSSHGSVASIDRGDGMGNTDHVSENQSKSAHFASEESERSSDRAGIDNRFDSHA